MEYGTGEFRSFSQIVSWLVRSLLLVAKSQLLKHHGYVSENASADLCFQTISQWLRDCAENHTLCAAVIGATPAGYVPTRLINVKESDGTITSKLVENIQEILPNTSTGHNLQYIALSHCWGDISNHPPKTTKSNLAQFKNQIPRNQLSKTFLDVLGIAYRLHIQYVWIDSLCIIQDDEDDWARQAANMALILASSTVTISSLAAANGNDGLFQNRSKSHIVEGDNKGKPFKICVRKESLQQGHSSLSNLARDRLPPSRLEFPLLTRAWVLQELLLAPRILYYSKEEIIW